MTTCQDILTRGLRSLGVLRAGQVPSGNDAADGLVRLQESVITLPGLMDGEWSDVFLTSAAAYEASDGERITTNGHAATITLPTTYENDCGDAVAMRDGSRVQIIGAEHDQAGVWVYTASKGAWAQVDALEINSDFPFGQEDEAGLAALTAVALSAEYGAPADELTVSRAGRWQRVMRARFYRAPECNDPSLAKVWY